MPRVYCGSSRRARFCRQIILFICCFSCPLVSIIRCCFDATYLPLFFIHPLSSTSYLLSRSNDFVGLPIRDSKICPPLPPPPPRITAEIHFLHDQTPLPVCGKYSKFPRKSFFPTRFQNFRCSRTTTTAQRPAFVESRSFSRRGLSTSVKPHLLRRSQILPNGAGSSKLRSVAPSYPGENQGQHRSFLPVGAADF